LADVDVVVVVAVVVVATSVVASAVAAVFGAAEVDGFDVAFIFLSDPGSVSILQTEILRVIIFKIKFLKRNCAAGVWSCG
jgi:hypothetical protein